MHFSTYTSPRSPTSATRRSHVDVTQSVAETAEHIDLLEHRRRFAVAIAKPRSNALLINAHNGADGWCKIGEAVAAERAFAVEVDAGIFAVDADRPDGADGIRALAENLRAARHTPLLIASGQEGHLHLFARVPSEDEHREFAKRARALGLDVRRCIRPPLAPHRLGLHARLLEPADPDEALRVLEQPRATSRLSPAMQRLLENGDNSSRYLSRSEIVQALTQAAVNAGWRFDSLFLELCDGRNAGGQKVQEILERRGTKQARVYVRRSWTRAEARAQTHPPVRDRAGARSVVMAIQRQADECAWPGKAGSTNRAVLQAHIMIAHRTGRLVYAASVRGVAELAAVAWPTAHRAQRRLVARGWLRLLERGRRNLASLWRLRPLESQIDNTHNLIGGV